MENYLDMVEDDRKNAHIRHGAAFLIANDIAVTLFIGVPTK